MLSVEEIWAMIDREVSALPAVPVDLEAACGRRLAEDIRAGEDMPAFARSAVDGYAVAEGSAPGIYQVIGEHPPGLPPLRCPEPGEALKIFTGSALPDSGVELIMVEDTEASGNRLLLLAKPGTGSIRGRGSHAAKGDVLLRAGMPVNPGAVALLASVGKTAPLVSPVVRVAHLVTGSELIPASAGPSEGFIRDSNSPLIAALLAGEQAERVFHGHVSESIESAVKALQDTRADLFLISGGASVGAHDGTAEVLGRLGFRIHCAGVKMRPGKPLIFATRGAQAAFGLPGNPLSHFVCFQLFVRRAMGRMQGLMSQRKILVKVDGAVPAVPVETWWPARVRAGEAGLIASPLPWRDSSDLIGLPAANALLRFEPGQTIGLADALFFGTLES